MTDSTETERLLFPAIFTMPVVLEFDRRLGSSDGGAILLKAAERRYGLIAIMSGCLHDSRQAGKVDHSLQDLFAQRVFSIGCGYADANDSARLAGDPMRKMLLDRVPVTGLDMASGPTDIQVARLLAGLADWHDATDNTGKPCSESAAAPAPIANLSRRNQRLRQTPPLSPCSVISYRPKRRSLCVHE